jgi:hypothetical protein
LGLTSTAFIDRLRSTKKIISTDLYSFVKSTSFGLVFPREISMNNILIKIRKIDIPYRNGFGEMMLLLRAGFFLE